MGEKVVSVLELPPQPPSTPGVPSTANFRRKQEHEHKAGCKDDQCSPVRGTLAVGPHLHVKELLQECRSGRYPSFGVTR